MVFITILLTYLQLFAEQLKEQASKTDFDGSSVISFLYYLSKIFAFCFQGNLDLTLTLDLQSNSRWNRFQCNYWFSLKEQWKSAYIL